MNLIYVNYYTRIIGRLRFLIAKAWFNKKLKASWKGIIGRNCGLFIEKNGHMDLAGKFVMSKNTMLYTKGEMKIGNNFFVNSYSRIIAHDGITIGDNVTIAQFVTILDHDHAYIVKKGNLALDGFSTAPIKIGNNIWIADKCTILKGVTIGDNVVIGAHTLVNKDVPSGCVIAGSPFKIIRYIIDQEPNPSKIVR